MKICELASLVGKTMGMSSSMAALAILRVYPSLEHGEFESPKGWVFSGRMVDMQEAPKGITVLANGSTPKEMITFTTALNGSIIAWDWPAVRLELVPAPKKLTHVTFQLLDRAPKPGEWFQNPETGAMVCRPEWSTGNSYEKFRAAIRTEIYE